MGVDLSPADVDALGARTEGWIAGLPLAALSLRALAPQGPSQQGPSEQGNTDRHAFVSTFSGSHHYILDYLTQEVLQRLLGPVQ